MFLLFAGLYLLWGSALLFCNCVIDKHYPRKCLDIVSSCVFVLFWPCCLFAAVIEDEPCKVQEV
jgi:hypothetical protein